MLIKYLEVDLDGGLVVSIVSYVRSEPIKHEARSETPYQIAICTIELNATDMRYANQLYKYVVRIC